jgi:hypothetical protein
MPAFPSHLDTESLSDFLDNIEPADLSFTDMTEGDSWSEDEENN